MEDLGKICVFDIRYHQTFATPQPIIEKIEFSAPVPAAVGVTGYALLLTNKVISINGAGLR